jgi:hypothetical protein
MLSSACDREPARFVLPQCFTQRHCTAKRITSLSLRKGFAVLAKGAKLAGRSGSHATWLE